MASGSMQFAPDSINTQLLTNAGISENTGLKKYIVSLYPMKRLGKSEEIASGFIFLASADNSFMTGTAIEIDGGYLAQ
jgi:NAD(P)-dependent dehydrogenase (short-subunit alcohol dehydrogenase family)